MTAFNTILAYFIARLPRPPQGILEWAEEHIRIPGGARGDRFRADIAPWLREPLLAADNPNVRQVDLVKPVQSGGSLLGEIMICRWIYQSAGRIQYNWEDGEKADDRWTERIEPVFRNTKLIAALWPTDRTKSNRQFVSFPGGVFQMQGVKGDGNLDSASVKLQINEEVHNWEPGKLAMATDRLTAFWNSKQINISNAGKKHDQLYQAQKSGTDQILIVKCPACGFYHDMHTRYDKRHPELGGLRYDSDGCKRADGSYDYIKLEPTIRYQFPCWNTLADRRGLAELREEPMARKAIALSCKYSEPRNTGAPLFHRSYTYDSVVVDYIPFVKLIMEKHAALRARDYGDLDAWHRYITHKECLHYDPNDVPIAGKIVLNSDTKKDREGMKDRYMRVASLDRQKGRARENDFPHWWLCIQDFDARGNTLIVFEGRLDTDESVVETLKRHDVDPWCVVADSGDDTDHVYAFCLQNGYHAIKGGKESSYPHPAPNGQGSVRRIYSIEKPLHGMITGRAPLYDYLQTPDGGYAPDPREPMFFFYSRPGIFERFNWFRGNRKFDVPGDVSDDFQQHLEAWDQRMKTLPSGDQVVEWFKLRDQDHLYMCCAYNCGIHAERAGLIGARELEAA